MTVYRQSRWGPFRFTRTMSSFFAPYSVGPSYALIPRDEPWYKKLAALRGIRITWANKTYWLDVWNTL